MDRTLSFYIYPDDDDDDNDEEEWYTDPDIFCQSCVYIATADELLRYESSRRF